MTPTYLNSAPSPFPTELMKEDQNHHLIFTPSFQASSSSSLSSHALFNANQLDHSGNYHEHTQQLQYQQEGNNYYDPKNESDNGLKLTLWKKEEKNENQGHDQSKSIKWMSSKMRLMRKMKNSDRTVVGRVPKKNTSQTSEDDQYHKKQVVSSDPMDTDHNSSNSSYNFNNIPIRVCSDCNTTKTPLWRSGPRGPKSLCNACGIRQRKARRAMAAAAAAANGATTLGTERTPTPTPTTTSSLKIKIQNKEKKSNNTIGTHQVVPYKKRSKMIANSMTRVQKKLCFEDLVINLSKNLDFHRVFPQDEKEAAILLMALSCGLVHG